MQKSLPKCQHRYSEKLCPGGHQIKRKILIEQSINAKLYASVQEQK